MILESYNRGITKVLGKTLVQLKVDQASDDVEALAVPNHLQQIPIIIGQSFISGKDKMVNV